MSSKDQARARQSIPDQEKQLKTFCDEHGLELLDSYSDVSTARHEHTISKRPGFNEVCQLALDNDYPIVVTLCNRFTRTYESYERFRDSGGRLIAIELGLDGNEHGISALIKHGEAQAEQTSRTSRAGIASAQANGKKTGNRNPVAGREASILARSASRQKQLEAFVAEVAKARTAGYRTPDEITIYLNTVSDLKTARGGPWSVHNVKRMLKDAKAAENALQPSKIIVPLIVSTPPHHEPIAEVIESEPEEYIEEVIESEQAEYIEEVIESEQAEYADNSYSDLPPIEGRGSDDPLQHYPEFVEDSGWPPIEGRESDGPLQHYPDFGEDIIEPSHDTEDGVEEQAETIDLLPCLETDEGVEEQAATASPPPAPDLVSLAAEELEALREYLDLRGYPDEKVERFIKLLSRPMPEAGREKILLKISKASLDRAGLDKTDR